ncbi:MAG: hypothetical protein ABR589_08075 [Chthoniobacterales bacterium]
MASPFQTYTVHYQSGGSSEALIQLFNAGVFIGNLTFHKDGTALPANVLQEGGVHDVHYHLSRFRDVLQILQYEKPLHIRIDNGVADLMATGFEPVGEQEGH